MHTNESNSGELSVLEDHELDLVGGGSIFRTAQAMCAGLVVGLVTGSPALGAAATIYYDQTLS